MMSWSTPKREFGVVRSCFSKVSFHSLNKAGQVCKKLAEKKARFQKPYKCIDCGRYHTATCTKEQFEQDVLLVEQSAKKRDIEIKQGKWVEAPHGKDLICHKDGSVLATIYHANKETGTFNFKVVWYKPMWEHTERNAIRVIKKLINGLMPIDSDNQ